MVPSIVRRIESIAGIGETKERPSAGIPRFPPYIAEKGALTAELPHLSVEVPHQCQNASSSNYSTMQLSLVTAMGLETWPSGAVNLTVPRRLSDVVIFTFAPSPLMPAKAGAPT